MAQVTIGIPFYNAGRYLEKSIRSVLNQTYQDWQLILLDDGSTDDSLAIAQSFQSERVQVLSDGSNHGVAYRLNQLIDLATGTYFVRMDGDDLMFPDRLEQQIRYLEAHPEVDVLGSPAIVIDEQEQLLGLRGEPRQTWGRDDLFFSSRFVHPTVTGRTAFFRRLKYDATLSGCEDMDLWIRGYDQAVYAETDEPLLFYREYLKMRLSTYLRRQRLLMTYAWSHRNLLERKQRLLPLLGKAVLSSLAAIVAHLCRCDRKLVLRRNRPLTPDASAQASVILQMIQQHRP